jgi:lysophospholipase L1-like esterase
MTIVLGSEEYTSSTDLNHAFLRRNSLSGSGETASQVALALGLLGSLALFPLVAAQGRAIRRRVPCLPPAKPPHSGLVPGDGASIRLLAIGESTVAGVGLTHGDETVAATTARALARLTNRRIAWRAEGLSGATVNEAMHHLLPRVQVEPADLLIVAFGVNDITSYRSPSDFANDLAALVTAVRDRVGEAAVVIAGVAPIVSFPALPWPLRTILGWRSAALQLAAERLTGRLQGLVVERISGLLGPDLFAIDGFHPNAQAHKLWGEEIATLALPLLVKTAEIPLNVQPGSTRQRFDDRSYIVAPHRQPHVGCGFLRLRTGIPIDRGQ